MASPVSTSVDASGAVHDSSSSAEGIECRVVGVDEKSAWNAFVSKHSSANLGHRFEWLEVFESSYRKKCYPLAAFRGEQWVGVLPLAHMRGPLSDGRLVSLPFLDQAGVLNTCTAIGWKLMESAVALARDVGASGVECRSLGTCESKTSERVTLELELPDSSEALWKSFKPKVRNQVRKSEKGELVTSRASSERLGEFYRVFCENMRDLGSPVHGLSFLEAVFDRFGESAALYLTENAQGRVVGGAIAIQCGDRVTVPWASSLREVFTWCPNHSLYWKILSDCADSGVARFDFGRSWVGAGTHKFKTQWGAIERPLVWSTVDLEGRSAEIAGIRPGDHGRAVRIWSRLPLLVASTIGPIIRRQLSN